MGEISSLFTTWVDQLVVWSLYFDQFNRLPKHQPAVHLNLTDSHIFGPNIIPHITQKNSQFFFNFGIFGVEKCICFFKTKNTDIFRAPELAGICSVYFGQVMPWFRNQLKFYLQISSYECSFLLLKGHRRGSFKEDVFQSNFGVSLCSC